ncbi:MAG: hypothetical protein ABS75_25095 [Pelagibacterium sp. SCN 63-23]|nr:MAG: hypothetical protein ABS75_25095 [Pelagibacterium sp. SCN 63-23]
MEGLEDAALDLKAQPLAPSLGPEEERAKHGEVAAEPQGAALTQKIWGGQLQASLLSRARIARAAHGFNWLDGQSAH